MVISLFQQSGGGGSSGDKIGIAPPTVSSSGLVYDGTAKSPVIGSYNTDAVTVAYTPQTNAGTYNYTLALKDKSKYVWLNTYDSNNQTGTWSIAKANGSSSLSKYAVELGEGESDNVIVTRTGTGAVQAVSSNPSIAAVSVSGTTVTILDGGTEGTATVSISVAADNNYNAVGAKTVTVEVSHGPEIVTFANGTDAQLAAMLEAHYAGTIDIHDHWNVGDERTVALSAMAATGVGESHVAQNVTMVLMNAGGKTLANGKTCAFVVGQKNTLANGTSEEYGYMNSSTGNKGGWDSSDRRTWCNNTYYNAIASGFKALLKQCVNKTSKGSTAHAVIESLDYCALASEKEIFGSTTYANATAEADNSQFTYYTTSANRIKKAGDSGSACIWWERSPRSDDSASFCIVGSNGKAAATTSTYTRGIAPFGCI